MTLAEYTPREWQCYSPFQSVIFPSIWTSFCLLAEDLNSIMVVLEKQ